MDLLKANVIKPGSELHSKLESRLTVTDINNLDDSAYLYYEDEEIVVHGDLRHVRRLFVCKNDDSEYDGVGWIINEDINECMVCAQPFGMFRWHHHCRCCGNMVCHACSPETAVIQEFKEQGAVRICIQCYWGQDPVTANNYKRNSFSLNDQFNSDYLDEYFTDHELGGLDVTPRDTNEFTISTEKIVVMPVPAFVVAAKRKLTFLEVGRMNVQAIVTRKIFINICLHSCIPYCTNGGEYYICDDVALCDVNGGLIRPQLLMDAEPDEDDESEGSQQEGAEDVSTPFTFTTAKDNNEELEGDLTDRSQDSPINASSDDADNLSNNINSTFEDSSKYGTPKSGDSAAGGGVDCEIYHVIVDPKVLRLCINNDEDINRRNELLTARIVKNIAQKFQLSLSRKYEILDDVTYHGSSMAVIHIPCISQ